MRELEGAERTGNRLVTRAEGRALAARRAADWAAVDGSHEAAAAARAVDDAVAELARCCGVLRDTLARPPDALLNELVLQILARAGGPGTDVASGPALAESVAAAVEQHLAARVMRHRPVEEVADV